MANLLLSVAARGAGFGANAFGGAISSIFSSLTGNCIGSVKQCLVCPHPTECGCIGKKHKLEALNAPQGVIYRWTATVLLSVFLSSNSPSRKLKRRGFS